MGRGTEADFVRSKREHICLITNHGYAGVDIPIGGAPDSGGQIIYVNEYARALDELGYKVTVFTRGGFPFFNKKKIRKGSEFLSPYARYVYVPGGGKEFILKEDIGNVLDEQLEWLYEFINREAALKKVKPYKYFLYVNTHYWDGAVLGDKLVERWQNDLFIEQVKILKFPKDIINKFYAERHKLSLSRNVNYFMGEIFFYYVRAGFNKKLPDNTEVLSFREDLIHGLTSITGIEKQKLELFLDEVIHEIQKLSKPVIFTFLIEKLGQFIISKKLPSLLRSLQKLNTHV
ncbi:MAG: hypothetical protein KKH98_07015, partial [Spirochaetes bacterium]|nr:hypothetical protein [Spirochaetota bacterium]